MCVYNRRLLSRDNFCQIASVTNRPIGLTRQNIQGVSVLLTGCTYRLVERHSSGDQSLTPSTRRDCRNWTTKIEFLAVERHSSGGTVGRRQVLPEIARNWTIDTYTIGQDQFAESIHRKSEQTDKGK
ncbi:hypothetical protein LSAT2_015622 [Lamellibrachia satsuma]|nr:hypothetical protein LSAT2_015622 [Lamellibrachia satsuma]